MLENGIAELPQVTTPLKEPASVHEARDYSFLAGRFFGFDETPFSNTPDPNFFFMSRHHREALMSMTFGVEQRKGFIVVSGEIGAGKTTVCRQFLQQLSGDIRTAVILNPKISTTHLLSSVVSDFGIQDCGKTRRAIYEGLSQFLLRGIQYNQNACIIIDEAQCLSVKVLEEIRLLSNLETSKQKLLQIVLVGQPELKTLLQKPSLTQLRQRIGVYVHLNGLALEETQGYIDHRLEKASGGALKVVFEAPVIQAVHDMTRGVPRLINAVCDRILMAAFTEQTRTISMETAQSALDEMAFVCADA